MRSCGAAFASVARGQTIGAEAQSGRQKLKNRISSSNLRKCFDGSIGRNWKEAPNRAFVIGEICLQYRGLFGVSKGAKSVPSRQASQQGDFTGSLGISRPLRTAARRDQKCLVVEFQQAYRGRIQLARLPALHLQLVNV